MAVKEAEFLDALRLAFGGRKDVRIWRQLVGNFWTRYGDGDFRPVSAGPPKGAADLSGIVLGSGRRLEIEVKGPGGKLRSEQVLFRENMLAWGAVHMVCFYNEEQSLAVNVAREMRTLDGLIRTS